MKILDTMTSRIAENLVKSSGAVEGYLRKKVSEA